MAEYYAELDSISNFSFLRGAAHPEELVKRACELKLMAIGIADDNTLAGVVRAHAAAKLNKIKLIIGSRLHFADDTLSLILYPMDLSGYQALSRLLTAGKMRANKGSCELYFSDLAEVKTNVIAIALTPDRLDARFEHALKRCQAHFGKHRFFCAVNFLYDGVSDQRIASLKTIEESLQIPMVVTNSVIAHDDQRRALADIVACIKEHTTLAKAGAILRKNSERYLKSPEEMWRLFSHRPEWLTNSIKIADLITFSLAELRYQYPSFVTPGLVSDHEYLVQETWKGAHHRYGQHLPAKVKASLDEELELVRDLGYATYFLTVYDIVNFARKREILCQGRGSAANSAICYCLGITEVDPNVHDLLFGRFISRERNEPPDIDVDFENAAREEVMQYIFQKYGRTHAAITATVITYRKRSAVREVAKVFGLGIDAIDALMRALKGISLDDISDEPEVFDQVCRDAGLSNKASVLRQILSMAKLLLRFPRHLGQHVGGFVINQDPLHELVPIGNAAMDGRTFIEWDKDDLDALGILKVDILALGMLSAIKRAFRLIDEHGGRTLTLANIKRDDKNVYDMLSRADAIGVFQVESRAQMSMLPRLKPQTFYDLVIEVAIIRPGPIQGDMVHPYLRRRNGQEAVTYPSAALKKVLEKTLGVPLFQEQVMQVAVVGAGFTPGEADTLRRSMASFKRLSTVNHFYQRFIDGMRTNGYDQGFAERVFNQILGFAEYGFPESHAASFANLVYVSAWLKYYYPEAFACALLNSQPMGFYAPAQIISDAKRHGVKVLPIDINESRIENRLSQVAPNQFAIRLGFQEIRGLRDSDIEWLIASRPKNGFTSIADVFLNSSTPKKVLLRLNKANAFLSLGIDERQAEWQILGLPDDPPPLLARIIEEEDFHIHFQKLSEFERVHRDYHYTGFSLTKHPLAFIRSDLSERGFVSASDIGSLNHGREVKVAGLVIVRQRPATAKGVIFFTLEDETGLMNIVIWPSFAESHRQEVLLSPVVAIKGRLEQKDGIHHIIANDIHDLSNTFHRLTSKSRNFH